MDHFFRGRLSVAALAVCEHCDGCYSVFAELHQRRQNHLLHSCELKLKR